jgi:hypothetical protein
VEQDGFNLVIGMVSDRHGLSLMARRLCKQKLVSQLTGSGLYGKAVLFCMAAHIPAA